jgi:hypothetical protein
VLAKTGQQESCIVAYAEPGEEGFTSARIQFLRPRPDFWHVAFPPEDWTPRHADSKFNKRPPLRPSVVAECVELSSCQ